MVFVLVLAAVASAQTAPGRKALYDESADAHADIAKAVAQGQRDHKRILLVFGANW
jgi:protein disulfide-isomerase